MPTFAERIPSFDQGIAAHGSGNGTLYGTRRSVRVVHGSEGVGHRSPCVGMRSEDLHHPEAYAAMRFKLRALRSLLVEHAHVFVGMP